MYPPRVASVPAPLKCKPNPRNLSCRNMDNKYSMPDACASFALQLAFEMSQHPSRNRRLAYLAGRVDRRFGRRHLLSTWPKIVTTSESSLSKRSKQPIAVRFCSQSIKNQKRTAETQITKFCYQCCSTGAAQIRNEGFPTR